jgi:hypothetical protein
VASFHSVSGANLVLTFRRSISEHAGAAFVELYFTLASLFASRAYYAFGFVALAFMVVALTTATVSILFSYFILCAEEYRYVDRSPSPEGAYSSI